jgi:probable selenium-dependent hydroxylase accessory protein YqeC
VEPLSAWFEREIFGPSPDRNGGIFAEKGPPLVLCAIGSGGKTSLIWHVARSLFRSRPALRILVTPTTKMRPPPPGEPVRYCGGEPAGALAGITLSGRFNKKTGKIESLPPAVFEALIPAYDLVLAEGDGSRELPLKGWAAYEPAVPAATTVTIGILPISALGMRFDEETVFRPQAFSALCGAVLGETIRLEHLAAVITGNEKERGLFAGARGKKLLFLNQAGDRAALDKARELASLLPAAFRSGLYRVIAGSVHGDSMEIL